MGRSKANGSWEDAVEASPPIRVRLSTTQLERLALLSALGPVAIEGSDVTLRCFDLETAPGPVLGALVDVVSALVGTPQGS
jgi:hypothetical protein